MKVITIGTDRKIFEEGSAVRERMVEYGKLFEKLEVIVFSNRSMNHESRIMLSDNVFVYPTNSGSRSFYIWNAFCIASKLLRTSYFEPRKSVVSTQDPFETGLVGLLLKLRYKLPLQVQLHTDFANKYFITHNILNFVRFPLGLFVLSFADSVRVVSERIKKSINALAHNVSILPIQTSPLASRSPLLVKERGGGKVVTFLTVARLEKEKDLETAIRAFKNVVDTGIDAIFTIVGDGSERKSLELLAKRLEVEEKVKFVGWQNDLAKFYLEADIYISTSLYEGYGMSMVEAASYGLPLILSDAGVAGDIFRDKEEALICKLKDIDEFARAMQKLASDFGLRHSMGGKAKESVNKHSQTWGDYLGQYKKLMQQAYDFYQADHGIFKRNILLRYFVAGITAASTNIGLLYIFTDILGIWYLYSSILAFVIGISISFVLQKFWTFGDKETSKIHHQALRYLGVAIFGLGFNTLFMFFLVDILNIWYILAQVITGGLIMVLNFLMYKFFIFNQQ